MLGPLPKNNSYGIFSLFFRRVTLLMWLAHAMASVQNSIGKRLIWNNILACSMIVRFDLSTLPLLSGLNGIDFSYVIPWFLNIR